MPIPESIDLPEEHSDAYDISDPDPRSPSASGAFERNSLSGIILAWMCFFGSIKIFGNLGGWPESKGEAKIWPSFVDVELGK
jgi:hypothetical protein